MVASFPTIVNPATNGKITVTGKLYRATHQNIWLDDITVGLRQGRVSNDASGRSGPAWTLDATISQELWRDLEPYKDWVAPVLRVVYPDGTVTEGQLGLYQVMDSGEQGSEVNGTAELDARDPWSLLERQGFRDKIEVTANQQITATLRRILDTCVLMDGSNGKPRWALPTSNKTFRKEREWPRDMSKAEVFNEVAKRGGYYPGWANSKGILTTRGRGVDRLRDRHPLRTFLANAEFIPAGELLLPRYAKPFGGLKSDIWGNVGTTPKSSDMQNEIILINDDFDASQKIEIRKRIANKQNKRSGKEDNKTTQAERRKARHYHRMHVEDAATADQVARAMREELSLENNVISFNAFPDARFDFTRETVGLAIFGLDGYEWAYGHYAVFSVAYGFTPDSGTMKMTAGKIEDATDITEPGDN